MLNRSLGKVLSRKHVINMAVTFKILLLLFLEIYVRATNNKINGRIDVFGSKCSRCVDVRLKFIQDKS